MSFFSGKIYLSLFAFQKEGDNVNEENQTTDPIPEDTATESGTTEEPTTESTEELNPGDSDGDAVTKPPATTEGENMFSSDGVVVTSPIDNREQTILRTGDGEIHVIHEITLGEVVLSTIIMALLVFMVLDRVIRR